MVRYLQIIVVFCKVEFAREPVLHYLVQLHYSAKFVAAGYNFQLIFSSAVYLRLAKLLFLYFTRLARCDSDYPVSSSLNLDAVLRCSTRRGPLMRSRCLDE